MIPKLATAVLLAGAVAASPAAAAPGLKVILSGGFSAAYKALLPEFERSTGITVESGSGASEGEGPQTIRYQLAHGTKADVVILSGEGLAKLVEDKRIRPGSAKGLGDAALGAAVRTGDPGQEVGTADALKQAVVHAGSVVLPGSTSGQFVRDKVFPRLKLPPEVRVEMVARGTEAAEALRSGKVNLAIEPTSELVTEPGIHMIGLLPDDMQIVQTFTAAIVNDAENPQAAAQLIAFLSSDRALEALKKTGMQKPKRP